MVNGQVVGAEEIQAVQARLGIPEAAQAQIPPGRCWYDPMLALWGMEAGPTLVPGDRVPARGVGPLLSRRLRDAAPPVSR